MVQRNFFPHKYEKPNYLNEKEAVTEWWSESASFTGWFRLVACQPRKPRKLIIIKISTHSMNTSRTFREMNGPRWFRGFFIIFIFPDHGSGSFSIRTTFEQFRKNSPCCNNKRARTLLKHISQLEPSWRQFLKMRIFCNFSKGF